MRREKLEHLVTTEMIEEKRCREKMLNGLTKWLNIGQVTDALKVMRDRDGWKVIVLCANEQGTY